MKTPLLRIRAARRIKLSVSVGAIIVTVPALFISCARDPYARGFGARYGNYERYEPSVVQLARMRHQNSIADDPIAASQGNAYTVADVDVINYTDHVKAILRPLKSDWQPPPGSPPPLAQEHW